MTDRELLELAAKAAGLPYTKPSEDYDGSLGLAVGTNPMRTQPWAPLTDDGDALRLAVALSIYVQPFTESARPSVFCRGLNHIVTECVEHFDEHDGDAAAATRYAIVRAAAEIGKAMQGEL